MSVTDSYPEMVGGVPLLTALTDTLGTGQLVCKINAGDLPAEQDCSMSTKLEALTKSLRDAVAAADKLIRDSRRADAAAIAAAEAALEAAKTAQRLHDAAIRAASE